MATRLEDLRIRRVALVDKGANQGAQVELFKREGEAEVADTKQEAVSKADYDALLERVTKAEQAQRDAEKAAQDKDAAVTALQKQAEDAQQRVVKLEEEREVERFAKIAKDVPHLGSATDLRAIAKGMGAEGFAKYLEAQRAVAQQLAESALFQSIGTGGDEEDAGVNARIEKIAKALQEKDPKLTWEQANAEALGKLSNEEYETLRQGSYVRNGKIGG